MSETSQKNILNKLIPYLEEHLSNFKIDKKAKPITFSCPYCDIGNPTAQEIPGTNKANCLACNQTFNIINLVRYLEDDKMEYSDNDIFEYLSKKYNIPLENESEKLIQQLFSLYERLNFDLVPIAKNDKAPIEKEWTHRNHKDKSEWLSWIYDDEINIGVKTGKVSNITVIDIDTKEVPSEIFGSSNMIQVTEKGFHYIYQYDADIPTTRIDNLKIDLLNDGKQFVVYPSTVNSYNRQWEINGDINSITPPKIPDAVKSFLLSKVTIYGKELKTVDEQIKNDIISESIDFSTEGIVEGNRNNFLIKYGGILRKNLNKEQTDQVLRLTNKFFLKPSLPERELSSNILSQLDKYISFDEKDLSNRILLYLRMVEEANSTDIKITLGEDKGRIEKALAYLVKEGYILKRRRIYHLLKKADWKDDLSDFSNPINFKVPYFDDVMYFNWGDMIVLGSKAKWGKTTISINMVKSLVDQGIKPYYICLETGSRFMKTAAKLGMKSGEFFYDFQTDPTKIELEPNAITIIDWLLIEDKSQTDSVMLRFVDQLYKKSGFLIIFMQLKKDGTWFAPNMVDQFPSMAARYLYEDENSGKTGIWHIDAMRESKLQTKQQKIICQYDWGTKILSRVDNSIKTVNDLVMPFEEEK